jgi:hypothetical protein
MRRMESKVGSKRSRNKAKQKDERDGREREAAEACVPSARVTKSSNQADEQRLLQAEFLQIVQLLAQGFCQFLPLITHSLVLG